MIEKIDELTAEQEEKLGAYREKWLALGLSTQAIDLEKAHAAIDLAYTCAALPPPKIKIWLHSPYEGVVAAWWLRQMLKTLKGKVLDQVRAKITAEAGENAGDHVADRLWADVTVKVKSHIKTNIRPRVVNQVRDQIGDPVKEQVRDRVWSPVWHQVKNQLSPQLRDPIWDHVWAQLWGQVWAQVWAQNPQAGAQIGDMLKAEIVAQSRDQIPSQIEDLLSTQSHCGGLHDANLLAPYDFFGTELGADIGKLAGLMGAAEHCGWFWPFGGAVILTEKPVEIARDNRGRLHNDKDMAIRYSDGWGVGIWHGTRVETWVITNPEKITIDNITEEKNAGARSVMRERFGFQDFFFAMIKEGKAKKISRRKDTSGLPMTLYRYDEKEAPIYFVHVYNGVDEPDGSRREFLIGCKNICDDAWDSVSGTYPDLMKELKDNPRKFEILKASIR